MSRFRPARVISTTVGALVILGVGVYGPATLLGPLPSATATPLTPAASATAPPAPVLPASGASAILPLDRPLDAATGSASVLARAGADEPLPIASAAKLITALVVLDAQPLEPAAQGTGVIMTAADQKSYLDYEAAGARTVNVVTGEIWTERELLQAVILGSSNNHADTLARWAFGSVDDYLAAASSWLVTNGLTDTTVADTTGLDEATTGTATDLARLAAIAAANPAVAEIVATPASALAGRRGVANTTEFLPEEGIAGISRSYTDEAGLCFLFTATVGSGPDAYTFAGAFLGEPDYDTLTADLGALMASARAGVGQVRLLTTGDAYARFNTAWGESAQGVVHRERTRLGWQPESPPPATVTLDSFSTGRAGMAVGTVDVAASADGPSVSASLKLDQSINGPDAGWRLLNPVPMIGALIASFG